VLDGLPIKDLSLATLLGVAILLIMLGRLVPRPTYNEKKEEAERWRLAYERERDAREVSDRQTVELLELAKTTHDLISAIVRLPSTRPPEQSGGSDVAVKAPL
jgi:hypothetical protein